MGDRLATIDMGPKVAGAVVPLSVGELGPNVTQCGLGQGLHPYIRTKYHLDLSSHLATIDMGGKMGGGCCAPFLEVELIPV